MENAIHHLRVNVKSLAAEAKIIRDEMETRVPLHGQERTDPRVGDVGGFLLAGIHQPAHGHFQGGGLLHVAAQDLAPVGVTPNDLANVPTVSTLMPLDIAALQYLYGEAAPDTNDDVYIFRHAANEDVNPADYGYSGFDVHDYLNSYVTIDDPGRMNVLGLFLAAGLRRNLEERGKACKLTGALTIEADGMRASVVFEPGAVTVTRAETEARVLSSWIPQDLQILTDDERYDFVLFLGDYVYETDQIEGAHDTTPDRTIQFPDGLSLEGSLEARGRNHGSASKRLLNTSGSHGCPRARLPAISDETEVIAGSLQDGPPIEATWLVSADQRLPPALRRAEPGS